MTTLTQSWQTDHPDGEPTSQLETASRKVGSTGPGRPSWNRAARSHRGSVTAELAVVLPAVTALLAVLMLSVAVGMLQLRLEEGARAGARALARGESSAQVLDIVAHIAGGNANVSMVSSSGGYATVIVEDRVGGVLSGFVPWTQRAQASARVESSRNHNTGLGASERSLASQLRADDSGGQQGSTGRKSTLWRWARDPECPLSTGWCTGNAAAKGGDRHGSG